MTTSVEHVTVIEQDNAMRLDRWISGYIKEAPKGLIFKWLRQGQVRVNGKRAKPDTRVQTGDVIRIPPLKEPTQSAPKAKTFSQKDRDFIQNLVILNETDFLLLNKPYGLAVQGGTKIRLSVDDYLPLLDEWLGVKDQGACRLVHRLDRDTTGVLIIAKNRASAQWFGQAFQEDRIKKTYLAVVEGRPPRREGVIRLSLPDEHERVQEAETQYTVLNHGWHGDQALSLVRLNPTTGRKHQLRRHCALKGFPILGDNKYNETKESDKLHLHAWGINFEDARGEVHMVYAPIPDHIQATLDQLGWVMPA